ncbi:MAG: hypothetical protein KDK96_11930 [Chlamydiia bacterium]|nr:hypothetical protein [Chlamydiia bacterium]
MGKRKHYSHSVVVACKVIQARDNVKFGEVIINYPIEYLEEFGKGILERRLAMSHKSLSSPSSKKPHVNMRAKEQLSRQFLSFGKRDEVSFKTIQDCHKPKTTGRMRQFSLMMQNLRVDFGR